MNKFNISLLFAFMAVASIGWAQEEIEQEEVDKDNVVPKRSCESMDEAENLHL